MPAKAGQFALGLAVDAQAGAGDLAPLAVDFDPAGRAEQLLEAVAHAHVLRVAAVVGHDLAPSGDGHFQFEVEPDRAAARLVEPAGDLIGHMAVGSGAVEVHRPAPERFEAGEAQRSRAEHCRAAVVIERAGCGPAPRPDQHAAAG